MKLRGTWAEPGRFRVLLKGVREVVGLVFLAEKASIRDDGHRGHGCCGHDIAGASGDGVLDAFSRASECPPVLFTVCSGSPSLPDARSCGVRYRFRSRI